MIKWLLIHSYLFAALTHGVHNRLPTTPMDDVRTWAYAHNTTIWDCPQELWDRLPDTTRVRLDSLRVVLDDAGELYR